MSSAKNLVLQKITRKSMSWVKKFTSSKGAPTLSTEKKRLEVAADFAYTLNHAIVCTLTDVVTDIPIGILVQNLLGKPEGEALSWSDFRLSKIGKEMKDIFTGKHPEELVQWAAGEVGGDFGAVGVVTAINRFAPRAVDVIRKMAAPIASPIFKRSTSRAARKEFMAQGFDPNSPECTARAQEMFNVEMRHLPNALLWTVFSPIINLSVQKGLLKTIHRGDWDETGKIRGKWENTSKLSHLALAKGIGATITSGLTLGIRNMSPKSMQKWDDKIASQVAGPIIERVSHLFGVDKEELKQHLDELHEKSKHGGLHPEKTITGKQITKIDSIPASNNPLAGFTKANPSWGMRTDQAKTEHDLIPTGTPMR
jgi:hypothetical protein